MTCGTCGTMNVRQVHEELYYCEECDEYIEATIKYLATCSCGYKVEVKQDADNPKKFTMNCIACGYNTTLTRN